jgi:medium-chain acyl-[acyl-carrier-protein] hydrolase
MNELSENDLTLFAPFRVSSADTDMFTRLSMGSLVNLLIQAAIQSADSLGFGFSGLKNQKLFWVLSRLTVEIYKPLHWNEETEVETWPKTLEGLLYTRDFIVRDKAQNIVARATSGWLAVDLEIKKPKIIDGLQAELFVYLRDKHALSESPEKIPGHESGEHFDVRPVYSDFDLNRHVTSTRYIDWMLDTFDAAFHRPRYPKRISVNFMKETLPGDSIRISRSHPDESKFLFEGHNQERNTIAFRGRIDF